MKTPVWLLMLLFVRIDFFLFFLNLVLGSVSIPFGAVWDICLWGDHENHIWTNIIWKSRMPRQSLRWLPERVVRQRIADADSFQKPVGRAFSVRD